VTKPPPPAVEIVIQPTRGLHFGSWREIREYRDLLWLLVWRDIVSRYKQTVLGPLWFVVQPVLTTIVFMVIFARVARIPTNGAPSSLFYMCGLVPWSYFALSFQSVSSSLVNNANMFGKVYFPRLLVPLSAVLSNLVALVIQLGTFFVFYFAEKLWSARAGSFGVTASVWLFPLVVMQVGALSLGVGLWVAALTAKFRDFSILAGFLLQLWMYVTPVVFPLSMVHPRWFWIAKLNPMTFPLESTRQMLLGVGSPSVRLFAASVILNLLILAGGLLVFRRVEKNFVDVI
jgi:lipopolysaccharide transport system permease protein